MAAARALSEAQLTAALAQPYVYRMLLIFGPDESAAQAIAANLAKKMGDIERVDMDGDGLKSDPALLADEASSQSLFGDKRFIRLQLKRDEAMSAIENFLDADICENLVIATAGNLTKTNKLRKLAEKSPMIATHICYQPGEKELVPLLVDNAKNLGLRLDRSLASQIAKNCNYNRTLALIEVEKLSLYYDSTPSGETHSHANLIDALPADFAKLSADTSADNQGELVNALLSGNIQKGGEEVAQSREIGWNPISVLRALQRRIILLAGMRTKVDQGGRAQDIVSKNYAVFWKDRDVMTIQLMTWSSQRLAALNAHLLDLEMQVMAAKADFTNILLEQELMKICRAAAKARRNR